MNPIILNGLFGGIGGFAKSAFGIVKAYRENPVNFDLKWGMVGVSFVEGIVGGIVIGAALPSNLAAFLGGAGLNSIADLNDWIYPKNSSVKKK
jgi:hypothetical protein